ncbi:MAG: B12-binding domain-containing radical SAM protein [Magnetococcales bacterium]|nr:B12-binding domain-containing radical SAM protein [Magnetococcales bacterium]
MTPRNIVLVYPKLGISGAMVNHLPLSILYAGVDAIKAGYDLRLEDVRLAPDGWQENLSRLIDDETLLLGISVMTGAPIRNALAISRWARKRYPQLAIVWGGPHATFNPEELFLESTIDYVISGYGSEPLAQLAKHLDNRPDALALDEIAGLSFRSGTHIISQPAKNRFEMIDFRDIPYHLIKQNLDFYGQLDSDERIFSLYSAMGCPYKCAFCSSPAQYRNIRRKYELYSPNDIVDHIEYVQQTYGATYIYFIDDDSFVRLSHVEEIIDEIQRRRVPVKLGFRGARINEIKKMSDEFLHKLAEAGTDIMHIGAESGSQRMLDLMRKDCTVEDIVEINLKMARHPEIKTAYNWIVALPGETMEDLIATQNLMLRLVRDNPAAILFPPNKFRPLPNTELYEIALTMGYTRPQNIEQWIELENSVESACGEELVWCSKQQLKAMDMMQVCSYFIDGKIGKVDTGKTLKYRLAALLAWLYTPFAVFRMRTNFSSFLFEKHLVRLASRFFN